MSDGSQPSIPSRGLPPVSLGNEAALHKGGPGVIAKGQGISQFNEVPVQFDSESLKAQEVGHDGDNPCGRAPFQELETWTPVWKEGLKDPFVFGGHEGMEFVVMAFPAEAVPDLPPLLKEGG